MKMSNTASISTNVSNRKITKTAIAPEIVDEPDKAKRLENTYKMKPDEQTVFAPSKVKNEILSVLQEVLQGKEYDAEECANLCCELSVMIKNKVKNLNFLRYKIISNVYIAPYADQGLKTASRCVWDDKTDSYACASFSNKSLVAIATVHGVFME